MATIRQYFETDFDYCLRVKVKYAFNGESIDGAIMFDASAKSAFCMFYFSGTTRTFDTFKNILESLRTEKIAVNIDREIALPAAKQFAGQLFLENANPLVIRYQLFGDPSWRDLFSIQQTSRVLFYSESNLSASDIARLQADASAIGRDLLFRADGYAIGRSQYEIPRAFISHDSRDKETIARRIAINLQRKVCPVWYDEFSLKLGDNLRQSIEKGLKECSKCVLVLSQNFFANTGWARKEFDSIFTREILEEQQLVLPIWCGVTKRSVYEYSPGLLNVKGVDWYRLGEEEVCRQIYLAVTSTK